MKRMPFCLSVAIVAAVALLARGQDASTKRPPPGTVRYVVGGDSRDDTQHVVRWAFKEAKERGAKAFIFLGDMEVTPSAQPQFQKELEELAPIPFYPVLGNHEVFHLGKANFGMTEEIERHAKNFRERFLGNARTPVTSSIENKVIYSVDLDGGLHFIALDNVSQKGFGAAQLAWLEKDLAAARARSTTRFIAVGMHEPLAGCPFTARTMAKRGGPDAERDSNAALALFQRFSVRVIFASHEHLFAKFEQGGIESYVSGGMGAPLTNPERVKPAPGIELVHHFLEVDVTASALTVKLVKFEGASAGGKDDDDENCPAHPEGK